MKTKKSPKSKEPQNGKQEIFFVEVPNYNGVKKSILESMKWILEMLHGYEKYKLLKHERLTASSRLNSQLKEISKLAAELKSKLPETNIRVKSTMGGKSSERSAAEMQKPVKSHREMSELEKLEAELRIIEDKLQGLG